jgi:hypothetical protein
MHLHISAQPPLQETAASSSGEFKEVQVRVQADGSDIWFSPRSLLLGGQQYVHNITIEWFALYAIVYFDSVVQSTSMTAQQQEEALNPRYRPPLLRNLAMHVAME